MQKRIPSSPSTIYYLPSTNHGFSIVELIVVIAIIAIITALTIVGYSLVLSSTVTSSLKYNLENAAKQLVVDQTRSTSGVYPDTLANANNGSGINFSDSTTTTYTVDNTDNPRTFCLTATQNSQTYFVTQEFKPMPGPCPVLYLDVGILTSYPGTGTTWNDLSGNGNNGTLLNGVGYNSANGGALTFDGVSDYGTIPYSANLSLPTFTLGVWVKPNGLQTEAASIFSDSYPPNVNYTLYFTSSTLNIMGGIYFGGWYNTNTATLTDGAWVYVVTTYDGANLSLYVNGGLVGVPTAVAITPSASGTPINIGKRWDLPDYFKGSIAIITLYNRSLSSTEITQNFNALRSRYGL